MNGGHRNLSFQIGQRAYLTLKYKSLVCQAEDQSTALAFHMRELPMTELLIRRVIPGTTMTSTGVSAVTGIP